MSFIWPAQNPELLKQLAAKKATVLAMDSVPRISRAQKLDALSSMANIAGYRAVIEAAHHFGRFFTGQITAAGKVPPAKVFVIGAGVAGLAAIGTASGLGAIVRANDTRPEVADQVKSMGGEFVAVDYQEEGAGAGGYARVMSEGFLKAQAEVFARQAKDVDIIITTALIPGRPAPKLITAEMVKSMRPGSVIVDLAAEQGGNCELTRPHEVTVQHGVTIIGYTDLPSRLARQSSTLYATNLLRLTEDLCKARNGVIDVNMEDEVIRGTTVVKEGEVTWPPPPPRLSAAPPAAARPAAPVAAAAKKGHGHGATGQMSGRALALVFFVGAVAFWFIGVHAPAAFLTQLYGVRAGLLRGLHGHLERHALAAYAAHERDQRHLEHHHHRRADPDRASAPRDYARLGRTPGRADPLAGGRRHRAHQHQHVRRLRRHAPHAGDVPQVTGSGA